MAFNTKELQRIAGFIGVFGFLAFTPLNEKKGSPEVPASYSILEKTIRSKYDSYAVFKWDEYIQLMNLLSQEKFNVLPLNEMRTTYSKSRVIVGLRHDVDMNPFKALEMAKLEEMYGIRATYFMLATAEYYGTFDKSGFKRSEGLDYLIKEIHNTGAEIGIHNDLLTVMIQHNQDPLKFNQEELEFYKSLKIPVYGTSSHGSEIARKSVPNYMIFSNYASGDSITYSNRKYRIGQYSLKQFRFRYEAYFIDFNAYYSDARGKWNDPEGFAGILKKLESSKAGDRIQILIHPDWWGRTSN